MSKGPSGIVRRENGLWRKYWMYGDVAIAKGPLRRSREEAIKKSGPCPVEWRRDRDIVKETDA